MPLTTRHGYGTTDHHRTSSGGKHNYQVLTYDSANVGVLLELLVAKF